MDFLPSTSNDLHNSVSSLNETNHVASNTPQNQNHTNGNMSRDSNLDDIDFEDRNEYNDYSDEWADDVNYFVPQNIADLCTLHPNTDCTVYDTFLMIYSYSVRHGLTWEAVEDLARLVNRIIGENKIAPSKYVFKKKFQTDECKPVKHFLCHECELYLGTLQELKDSKRQHCPNCKTAIQTDTKYKKKIISLQSHLKVI